MTMAEIETTEERQSIVTPRLRLAFEWTGDRWAHALEREDSHDRAILARSIEGNPERNDPATVPNPAYQQLSFQRTDSEVQALLVGQSGAHHFSAVFSVQERGDDVIIEVDVADRCRLGVPLLACTYLVHAVAGDLLPADPAAVAWEPPTLGRFALETSEPTRLALAEAGRSATRIQVIAPVQPLSPTQRCSYRWQWRPSGRGWE